MKWLWLGLLVIFLAAATSCTTLVNRRDLYSPDSYPSSAEKTGRVSRTTTTTIATDTKQVTPPPRPEFRY
jgi:hypothetical protein